MSRGLNPYTGEPPVAHNNRHIITALISRIQKLEKRVEELEKEKKEGK